MAAPLSAIDRLPIEREDNDGVTVLHLNGDFDRETAGLLRSMIEQLPPGDVILDFSRARNFLDLAVPMLTHGLDHRTIRTTGLPRHQERVFQYFGWGAGEDAVKAYYIPEDSLGN